MILQNHPQAHASRFADPGLYNHYNRGSGNRSSSSRCSNSNRSGSSSSDANQRHPQNHPQAQASSRFAGPGLYIIAKYDAFECHIFHAFCDDEMDDFGLIFARHT